MAEAPGSQRATSATGSRVESPPASPSRCAPKLTNWMPTAITSPLSTARSRPLRELSSRTLAVVTARDRATQSSIVSGTASTAKTVPAAPCASAITEPTTRQRVNSGPIPIIEETSSARTSGSGRSGSITSRVGSRVSSPLGKKSGSTAQPSATTAVSSTTTVPAFALPRSRTRARTWPAATSRAKTSEAMNAAFRPDDCRSPFRSSVSLSRTKVGVRPVAGGAGAAAVTGASSTLIGRRPASRARPRRPGRPRRPVRGRRSGGRARPRGPPPACPAP